MNNRFLLLKRLEGMEVNPTYPLTNLGRADASVDAVKKEIIVRLEVNLRPSQYCGRYKVNCYAYEVSLLCWNKNDGLATHARQYSEWIFHFNELLKQVTPLSVQQAAQQYINIDHHNYR